MNPVNATVLLPPHLCVCDLLEHFPASITQTSVEKNMGCASETDLMQAGENSLDKPDTSHDFKGKTTAIGIKFILV